MTRVEGRTMSAGATSATPTNRCRPSPLLMTGVVSIWVVALGGVIASPYLARSPTPGDDLTRRTADLAMAGYFIATAMMLFLSPADRPAVTTRGGLTRLVWTLSWATFLVHVGMAFHYHHGW